MQETTREQDILDMAARLWADPQPGETYDDCLRMARRNVARAEAHAQRLMAKSRANGGHVQIGKMWDRSHSGNAAVRTTAIFGR